MIQAIAEFALRQSIVPRLSQKGLFLVEKAILFTRMVLGQRQKSRIDLEI
ncbi:MAG: hypothetical protein J7K96_01645 [Desulfobacteraceae bacterium]|nr:hypothetical protein [Desulfobacteraceae bacterium]